METIPHFYNQCVGSVLPWGALMLWSHVHDLVAYAETGPECTSNWKGHQRLPFLWSIFKLPYLESNRWPPTPFLQLHAELCICPWAIIDRVHTILCNTRGGDLTAVEELEWWAIRGFPRHLMGDFMQRKTDRRARRRHEDQGGPFWRRGGRLPARGLGFPTTCCLVLNKRWHVVWRHPTPWLKGCPPWVVHGTQTLTLSMRS